MPHAMWVDCVWRWHLRTHSEEGVLVALPPGGVSRGGVAREGESLYPRLLSLLADLYTVSGPLWAEYKTMVEGSLD